MRRIETDHGQKTASINAIAEREKAEKEELERQRKAHEEKENERIREAEKFGDNLLRTEYRNTKIDESVECIPISRFPAIYAKEGPGADLGKIKAYGIRSVLDPKKVFVVANDPDLKAAHFGPGAEAWTDMLGKWKKHPISEKEFGDSPREWPYDDGFGDGGVDRERYRKNVKADSDAYPWHLVDIDSFRKGPVAFSRDGDAYIIPEAAENASGLCMNVCFRLDREAYETGWRAYDYSFEKLTGIKDNDTFGNDRPCWENLHARVNAILAGYPMPFVKVAHATYLDGEGNLNVLFCLNRKTTPEKAIRFCMQVLSIQNMNRHMNCPAYAGSTVGIWSYGEMGPAGYPFFGFVDGKTAKEKACLGHWDKGWKAVASLWEENPREVAERIKPLADRTKDLFRKTDAMYLSSDWYRSIPRLFRKVMDARLGCMERMHGLTKEKGCSLWLRNERRLWRRLSASEKRFMKNRPLSPVTKDSVFGPGDHGMKYESSDGGNKEWIRLSETQLKTIDKNSTWVAEYLQRCSERNIRPHVVTRLGG